MEKNENTENTKKSFICPRYTFTEPIPTYQYPYYVQALAAYGKADICIANSEDADYPYELLCEEHAGLRTFHECLHKAKMEEIRTRTDFDDIAVITHISSYDDLAMYQKFLFEYKSEDVRIVYCGDIYGIALAHVLVCNGIMCRGKCIDAIRRYREKEIFSKAPFENPILCLRFDENQYSKYSRAIALHGKGDFYIADCGISGNFSLYRYALLKKEGAEYSELAALLN